MGCRFLSRIQQVKLPTYTLDLLVARICHRRLCLYVASAQRRRCGRMNIPLAIAPAEVSSWRAAYWFVVSFRRYTALAPGHVVALSLRVPDLLALYSKKKLGLALVSDKGEGDRVYRIAG